MCVCVCVKLQLKQYLTIGNFWALFPLRSQIRCTARIHDIYLQSTERSIDEDRPRVISAASSANSNGKGANGNAVPYDHFPPYAENELDRKDYMTLQGELEHIAY